MDPLLFYKLYAFIVVPSSSLIPIFFSLKNYKRLQPALKILCIFIIVSSLFNVTNILASSIYHVKTLKWIQFYTVLEFTFTALVFSRIFSAKWRVPIYILIVLFALLCIADSVLIQNKLEFNTYTRPISALIIIAFCMAYIIKTGTIETKWTENNFNWINIGMLLYYSGGLVMFTFSNYFLTWSMLTLIIWTVHNSILIVEYILFSIGFYRSGKLNATASQIK